MRKNIKAVKTVSRVTYPIGVRLSGVKKSTFVNDLLTTSNYNTLANNLAFQVKKDALQEKQDARRRAVLAIDTIAETAQAVKGLGQSVNSERDKITSAFQWFVADHVYNKLELASLIDSWLQYSTLVGEVRRTAKEGIERAVRAWGQGNVTIQVNERNTANRKQGIHIAYPNEDKQKAEQFRADVKQSVTFLKKMSGLVLYEAMALLEMEKQEGTKATVAKAVDNIKAVNFEAVTADQEKRIAEKRSAILAKIA